MANPEPRRPGPVSSPEASSTVMRPVHQVDLLLNQDNNTLWRMPPTQIADMVRDRLNLEEARGRRIFEISPLSDYHVGADTEGGLKDMLLRTAPRQDAQRNWQTQLVLSGQTDRNTNAQTMYREASSRIEQQVSTVIEGLEEKGNIVPFAIPIQDNHFNINQWGAFGGVKNIVLCYYNPNGE